MYFYASGKRYENLNNLQAVRKAFCICKFSTEKCMQQITYTNDDDDDDDDDGKICA